MMRERVNERRQAIDEEQLLALWRTARAMAMRACARTILRLQAGEGGFYDADDLQQDLFLEFWRLVRCWEEDPHRQEEELWAAWKRALWHGGRTILKRAPQRLWDPPERQQDPEFFTLDADVAPESVHTAASGLADGTPALIQEDDAERTRVYADTLEGLEQALWALPVGQRQLLYMTAVAELPAEQVARCLGLPNGNAVHRRLHRARAALRRRLRA
jgi:RNA polymerase sigma factor (sigma-70 family)